MRLSRPHYLSTRDARSRPATCSFEEVLLRGLAEDGGLYVPEALPALGASDWRGCAGLSYAALAARLVGHFAGDSFPPVELERLAAAAYGGFRHAAVAPLVQLEDRLWLLELFHGPTLAFKDLALQLLGLLLDRALERRGERVTMIGATSGDTGSAAIAACRDRAAIDLFILYPKGRISEVQRRQMTTVEAANVHAVAVAGSFDDCQDLVKALFADARLRAELNLAAVNSINWARIAAQTVYYASAALALGAPDRRVSFSVPTGNFGNVYAGHYARRLGLPIDRLVIGSNRNDILWRYLTTGDMAVGAVTPTLSPSMDIQISSNFERLLFELKGGSGAATAAAMAAFRRDGGLPRDDEAWRAAQRLFSAHRFDDRATLAEIAKTHRRSGILIDPHTAVAVAAARAELQAAESTAPMVALATAHPAKFPEAVERATGLRPPAPPPIAELYGRPEHEAALSADLGAVREFIRGHARRARAAA